MNLSLLAQINNIFVRIRSDQAITNFAKLLLLICQTIFISTNYYFIFVTWQWLWTNLLICCLLWYGTARLHNSYLWMNRGLFWVSRWKTETMNISLTKVETWFIKSWIVLILIDYLYFWSKPNNNFSSFLIVASIVYIVVWVNYYSIKTSTYLIMFDSLVFTFLILSIYFSYKKISAIFILFYLPVTLYLYIWFLLSTALNFKAIGLYVQADWLERFHTYMPCNFYNGVKFRTYIHGLFFGSLGAFFTVYIKDSWWNYFPLLVLANVYFIMLAIMSRFHLRYSYEANFNHKRFRYFSQHIFLGYIVGVTLLSLYVYWPNVHFSVIVFCLYYSLYLWTMIGLFHYHNADLRQKLNVGVAICITAILIMYSIYIFVTVYWPVNFINNMLLNAFWYVIGTMNNVFVIVIPAMILVFSIAIIMFDNPIYSLLCLISVFFSIILILLSFKIEFLSMIFLIIYIGAVSILFLFVIMLFDLKPLQRPKKPNSFYLSAYGIGLPFLIKFYLIFKQTIYIHFDFNTISTELTHYTKFVELLKYTQDILVIGDLFYSIQVDIFISLAFILLTAMVGAIVLALSTIKQ